MKSKEKAIKTVKEYGIITLGILIASLGISLFLVPHGIVSGGASGVGIILNKLTGFPVGVTVFLINIPLFISGILFLGKNFGVKTLYGMFLFSLLLDATKTDVILTENILMSAIFGGGLLGIGFGCIFLSGATTGGTDILATLFNRLIPAIDMGKWFLIIDIFIISVSAVFFQNAELVLSGVIALFLNSFVMDYIISGANTAKMIYVISDHGEHIAAKIIKHVNRGVTGIKINGMYTHKERTMLMCIVKRFELKKLEEIVEEIDKNAFIILTQARKITGSGFINYPVSDKKNKNKDKDIRKG